MTDTESTAKFDIKKLKLSQNFSQSVGVKKHLSVVPVRKPTRQEFVRVKPGEKDRITTAILELKVDRESYLVAPEMWNELPGEIKPTLLVTTITRHGDLLLWPVKLPGLDGRSNNWHESALDAAKQAESMWVKVVANLNIGAYDVYEATGNIPEPEWPEYSFEEILEKAFRDKYIQDFDHPAVKKLLGAI